ncbi:hypothetical protein MKR81_19290 [Vibrio campbellii]|uniref:LPO_1073/Vpar_1526 family protein n=1 Tax=Vibrio campbellii TaxID=680 RepID=UPI001F078B6E|nr:LPO_1073/Vpar_1526 family protein [Vibrio campbellii]UMM06173.1 hypothetical protein MKR81_19290 [Vibrio campbellii]
MINNKTIKSDNECQNIQATNVFMGASAQEVESRALKVFEANSMAFVDQVTDKVFMRLESFNSAFISHVVREKVAQAFESFNDPSFQMTLFQAQKSFVKSNDNDLQDILIKLLTTRIQTNERCLAQIVLDEAIAVTDKLTIKQIKFLSLLFLTTKVSYRTSTLDELNSFTSNALEWLGEAYKISKEDLLHMQYVGAISHLESSSFRPINETYRLQYMGLFNHGFTMDDFNNHPHLDWKISSPYIINLDNDHNRYKLSFISYDDCRRTWRKIVTLIHQPKLN